MDWWLWSTLSETAAPPPLSITADRGGYAWTCLLWGGKGCCSTHDCVCVVIVVSSEHCLLGVSFIVVPTNDGQLRCIKITNKENLRHGNESLLG